MNKDRELVVKQKQYFQQGYTKALDFRLAQLQLLYQAIVKYEPEIMSALKQDLNKSAFEAYATEIGFVLKEIRFFQKHLKSWAKPQKVKTPITHIGSRSYIISEPYGVALIIAPWNYPFQLAIAPLVGAIAAGNCVLLKLSEFTSATAQVIMRLLEETFDAAYITAVAVGVQESQALLEAKPDYIFFTGSTAVGKIVMQAAAQDLIPITLELGGKSPCIVHQDADLKLAAKRIAWGKLINAGQTCIAPDYIYVHAAVQEQFQQQLIQAIQDLYGEDPMQNEAYTQLISHKHFDRLFALLKDGKLLYGGKSNRAERIIEPTILGEITWADDIMQAEIFGPLFPLLTYTHLTSVIHAIQEQPKPLALYFFSRSKAEQDRILAALSFGGGCINDAVYHMVSPYLPFGGIGSSGMGAYHGQASFKTFSHFKSILKQTNRFDLPFRYPNFRYALKFVKLFLK